ncbi:acetyl-CoA C-acyltransferase [Niveispirillum fermenti]|uniref:acetyl-CoA C-acyltransferase n=1 Tax=Niveispirillum fermenti TaxID=1233113 RepID=UPI003A88D7E4
MEAFIFDAVRSPRGKVRPDGPLAGVEPAGLVAQLAQALDGRVAGAVGKADALILGCVTQTGAQGGHVALLSKFRAGLPDAATAISVNNFCVSSLSAIGMAVARVALGNDRAVLAGGVEHMSLVPMMGDKASYYRDMTYPVKSRFVPVAIGADRLAATWGVGRDLLDAAALTSQSRAVAAEDDPALSRSRIPVRDTTGAVILQVDECIRPTTPEKLAGLAPAFGDLARTFAAALEGENVAPVHTIAHTPPMCDGAALALVGARDAFDVAPRARVVAFAEAGGDPHASLTAGFASMEKCLAQAGLTLADMDRIEFMEAFGVTVARFLRDYPVDAARVNVAGGALSRGHPLGASGGVLLSSLLDALEACDGRYGLAVGAGGSGVGAAILIERGDF